MAGVGNKIFASDFNDLYTKIVEVLGTGSGSYGYGQTVQSSSVSVGQEISEDQWTNLYYDLLTIKIHQDGSPPTIYKPGENTNDLISYTTADALLNYDALITQARSQRFDLSGNEALISAVGPGNATPTPVPGEYVYTSPWANQAQAVVTATFSDSNEARYFFNSGGRLRISSELSGSTNKAQTNAWVTTLDSIGEVEFGANTDPFTNFYTLTDSYETYFQTTLSAPYSANRFLLEAKCNVPDNSAGTATEVSLRITWIDGYDDPGNQSPSFPPQDGIDGTLILRVSEIKAAGLLEPSDPLDGGPVGNFSIVSPSYSTITIAAT